MARVTRRSFLHSAGAFALGAVSGVGGVWLPRREPPRRAGLYTPKSTVAPLRLRALSIRQYQQALRAALRDSSSAPQRLYGLEGLNKILAFTVEEGDVILIGDEDKSFPLCEIDQVLVALRSAFKAGPEYESTAPGCTIDPKPGVADIWKVQRARVLGMPTDAPMGKRHLDVDYDMKRAAAGLTRVGATEGSPISVFDFDRDLLTRCGSAESDVPASAVTRFWFCTKYPTEKSRYVRDGLTVQINHPVGVKLETEEEFLRNGIRVGGAAAPPSAVAFAAQKTRELATNDVREYVRLRQDFQLIELGKLLAFSEVSSSTLDYLLHECPMKSAPTPTWVGGIRRDESGEFVCDVQIHEQQTSSGLQTSTSESIHRYRHSFRGGVDASVVVEARDFDRDTGRLARLTGDLHRSRPSPEAVTWEFETVTA